MIDGANRRRTPDIHVEELTKGRRWRRHADGGDRLPNGLGTHADGALDFVHALVKAIGTLVETIDVARGGVHTADDVLRLPFDRRESCPILGKRGVRSGRLLVKSSKSPGDGLRVRIELALDLAPMSLQAVNLGLPLR